MATLASTKNTIKDYTSKIFNIRNAVWLGGKEINGTKVAKIKNLKLTARVAVLDANGQEFEMSFSDIIDAQLIKIYAIPAAIKSNVSDLMVYFTKLNSYLYDYEVGKKCLEKLKGMAIEDADNGKAGRGLYNYYMGFTRCPSPQLKNRFYERLGTKRFNFESMEEFSKEYVKAYEIAVARKLQEKADKKKADRRATGAVQSSYKGDINELIEWLKDFTESITITTPCITGEEDEADSETVIKCKESSIRTMQEMLEDLEAENKLADDFALIERPTVIYNCWELKLKRGYQKYMPESVRSWTYEKKSPSDIDTFLSGNVLVEKSGKLTSNPIIKDLVFNYGFKVGSQR